MSAVPSEAIGPYKLLRILGEGGMGTVWLAEQSEPLRRRVALKVLRDGIEGVEARARFEVERHALSLLAHPHVARVLDAGWTDDDRPFVVVECVDGEPVTQWCDREVPSVETRVTLMASICDAVQHAHQRGVLHRDIKPGNVMVEQTEEGPRAKVIDFGLAKALDDRLDMGDARTQWGQMVGTPAYMAPEQLSPSVGPVDTRTDVYMLGALLYEVICGELPHHRTAVEHAAFDEVLRRVLEEDPRPPSVWRDRPSKAPDGWVPAEGRAQDDLDWITLRAMARDPADRYESAAALAADLRRYLAHEPVEAGPPSTVYRLRKLVRRHRAAFVLGVVALLALVGGLAASLVLGSQARGARDLAIEARSEAVSQARRAQAILSHLRQMVAAAAPHEQGADVRMSSVLEAAAESAERDFSDEPALLAELHEALADTWYALQDAGPYARSAERALALRRKIHGPDDLRTLRTELRVAAADWLRRDGEALLERSSDLLLRVQSTLGDDHALTLGARRLRAMADVLLGRTEAAIAGLEPLVQAAALPPEQRAEVTRLLAGALADAGRHEDAEVTLRGALRGAEETLAPADPNRLELALALAYHLDDRRRFDESIAVLREMLASAESKLGPVHPWTLHVQHALAFSLGKMSAPPDQLQEAAALAQRAYEGGRATFGLLDSNTIASLQLRGRCLLFLGDMDGAGDVLEQALRLYDDLEPPEETGRASTLGLLGRVRMGQGRLEAAERLLREAHDVLQAVVSDQRFDTADISSWLAQLLAGTGQVDDALVVLRELAVRAGRVFGEDSLERALADRNVGFTLLRAQRLDAAMEVYEDVLPRVRRAVEAGATHHIGTLNHMMALYAWAKRADALAGVLDEAMPLLERRTKDDPDDLAAWLDLGSARSWAAELAKQREDPEGIRAAWERCIEARAAAAALSPEDGSILSELADATQRLAEHLAAAESPSEAIGVAKRLVALREQLEKNASETVEPRLLTAHAYVLLGGQHADAEEWDAAATSAAAAVSGLAAIQVAEDDGFDVHRLRLEARLVGARALDGLGRLDDAERERAAVLDAASRLAKHHESFVAIRDALQARLDGR